LRTSGGGAKWPTKGAAKVAGTYVKRSESPTKVLFYGQEVLACGDVARHGSNAERDGMRFEVSHKVTEIALMNTQKSCDKPTLPRKGRVVIPMLVHDVSLVDEIHHNHASALSRGVIRESEHGHTTYNTKNQPNILAAFSTMYQTQKMYERL